jgi:hypothetical protein
MSIAGAFASCRAKGLSCLLWVLRLSPCARRQIFKSIDTHHPPAPVNNVVTIRPPTALLDDPITGGNSVFLIAALLAAAVTYEAFQSLNRFAALTHADIPKSEKKSQNASASLTAPLLP